MEMVRFSGAQKETAWWLEAHTHRHVFILEMPSSAMRRVITSLFTFSRVTLTGPCQVKWREDFDNWIGPPFFILLDQWRRERLCPCLFLTQRFIFSPISPEARTTVSSVERCQVTLRTRDLELHGQKRSLPGWKLKLLPVNCNSITKCTPSNWARWVKAKVKVEMRMQEGERETDVIRVQCASGGTSRWCDMRHTKTLGEWRKCKWQLYWWFLVHWIYRIALVGDEKKRMRMLREREANEINWVSRIWSFFLLVCCVPFFLLLFLHPHHTLCLFLRRE